MHTKTKISLILIMLSLAGMAYSATLSVPDSSPTIKAAMIKARAGDFILVSCGTYYEHDILVKPGVSLWSGTLQPGCVTIDAEGKGRGLIFSQADSTTSVVGFTITGGRANLEDHWGQGGGILCIKSKPKISNCIIADNHAETGGGIFADKFSQLNLSNCRIENNTAGNNGGGLAFHGKAGILANCSFLTNTAFSGGGIFLKNTTDVIISESHLIQNIAGNAGGGILAIGSQCNLEGTVLSGNVGGLGGGGLAAEGSNPLLTHCTLYGNVSESDGCAFACSDSKVVLENSQLTYHPGPVMCSAGSVPLLSGCNLFGNRGGDWAGPLEEQAYKRHNISEPPLYCGAESGDFHLSSHSASLPANNPAGNANIIGALGIGCSVAAPSTAQAGQIAGRGM